ncbi:hypothetical protein [Kineosporia babensis]|uniref:Uncharacterized protein n=1 Tax=Kineosporia babensis TaxID=499548 RepID=A0A9X1SY59_9ACTN|nr:hypothetical protein [Kineosporia babensis]MCD5316539.1 hypothetical protein [Kineosporia babensis]
MRWIRAVYLIGFGEGTLAHLFDLITGGLAAYQEYALPFQVFFHSLIVLDPLVVVLIWQRRRAGAVLAAVVMALDMAANWIVSWPAVTADPALLLNPIGLPSITLFGGFVLLTFWMFLRPSVSETQPDQGRR